MAIVQNKGNPALGVDEHNPTFIGPSDGVKYTPTTAGDWTVPAPATVLSALDKLATDVKTLNTTSNSAPTGSIQPYAGLTLPTGWLWCDGSEVDRATYPALASALRYQTTASGDGTGTGLTVADLPSHWPTGDTLAGMAVEISDGATTHFRSVSSRALLVVTLAAASSIAMDATGLTVRLWPYGLNADADTFLLPDLRGRSPIGAGDGTSLTVRRQGVSGGAESVTLTQAQLPAASVFVAHTNASSTGGAEFVWGAPKTNTVRASVNLDSGIFSYSLMDSAGNTADTGASSPMGSDEAHSNMQPFLGVQYIIKT